MQPTLRPGATYLMVVVAIPTVDHHMVLDTAALPVNDGTIAGPDSDGYVMDVIKPFIGTKIADLPRPITVHGPRWASAMSASASSVSAE